jgi:cell division protein FtsI (penicillin-binding protein 3)
MLFNVVDKKWGTANLIKDSLFSISGKTGTCQVDYAKNEVQYISSFVGYFPSNDPIYSCIVVIHKPNKKKGYYGSQVAAPVFKEIAKKIYNSTPKLRVFNIKKSQKTYQKSIKIESLDGIPDLKGLPAMDALSLLENMGLKVVLKGTGKVVNQSIKKGVKVSKNEKIILELS